MLGYDFEIIYKKGKLNVVSDALSRKNEEVEYLGHILSQDCVKVYPKKIESIREWKVPPTIKKL